jgi:hypothetical protein
VGFTGLTEAPGLAALDATEALSDNHEVDHGS